MTAELVRVIVVDDSAFARKVVREVLSGDPRIDVVAIARDGLDALEKIAELKPDVVTLDLVMPNLDGVGVLDALRAMPSPPRVVVVTMSDAESVLGVAALQAGAFDVVHKPTALATDRLYDLREELVEKVLLAAASAPSARPPSVSLVPAGATTVRASTPGCHFGTKMLLIGASTGGPRAVTHILRALPGDLPVPVVVVVHMPAGYTEAFANRLDRECALEVVEADDGLALRPGRVLIARAGMHTKLRRAGDGWTARFDVQPMTDPHRPSLDALFISAASEVGNGVLAVVLTGMGSDGLVGARAIRAAGGRVIVEHASSCVVYGMPRAVAEEGLAEAIVPLEEMRAAILSRL